ncbi:MAG: methionine adenosyltransferase [Bacteroidetes bacterium HGW-Bacteroidetes-6]|jgi:S-adenosylmethionine synthetase|nr:MAG: methionine adenosyltransferase [Bacteroidetes bacterium HGW-Bacteroidetes-6]
MGFLFTSESVSEGHPDKVADQISDALLDEFLRQDPKSKVACETMVTTGLVVMAGEVTTEAWVDQQEAARKIIEQIGYTKPEYRFDHNSCGIVSAIHGQSPDIHQGVVRQIDEEQGAGDQGMMFGYASNEMDNFMPMSVELAHILVQELAAIRKEGKVMTYLRPDSKSQVTIEYDDNKMASRIDTIVISTQHDDFAGDDEMLRTIENDVRNILIPRVMEIIPARVRAFFKNDFKLLVNPTGKFVIGGPHGDSGLTGRKIIVDTYGGHGAHGGGAFSGKDPSKVDRSAAYAMRHIAKNLVAAGVADQILVQVAYAIGVARPVGFNVNTYGTAKVDLSDGQIADAVNELFDMRPFAIVRDYGLCNPIYVPTAAYGHFGRDSYEQEVEVSSRHQGTYIKKVNGEDKYFKTVRFFAWEQLNRVDDIRKRFGL